MALEASQPIAASEGPALFAAFEKFVVPENLVALMTLAALERFEWLVFPAGIECLAEPAPRHAGW